MALKGWAGAGKGTVFRAIRRLVGVKMKHVAPNIAEPPQSFFGEFHSTMPFHGAVELATALRPSAV